jgi:hypothetical protein
MAELAVRNIGEARDDLRLSGGNLRNGTSQNY